MRCAPIFHASSSTCARRGALPPVAPLQAAERPAAARPPCRQRAAVERGAPCGRRGRALGRCIASRRLRTAGGERAAPRRRAETGRGARCQGARTVRPDVVLVRVFVGIEESAHLLGLLCGELRAQRALWRAETIAHDAAPQRGAGSRPHAALARGRMPLRSPSSQCEPSSWLCLRAPARCLPRASRSTRPARSRAPARLRAQARPEACGSGCAALSSARTSVLLTVTGKTRTAGGPMASQERQSRIQVFIRTLRRAAGLEHRSSRR